MKREKGKREKGKREKGKAGRLVGATKNFRGSHYLGFVVHSSGLVRYLPLRSLLR